MNKALLFASGAAILSAAAMPAAAWAQVSPVASFTVRGVVSDAFTNDTLRSAIVTVEIAGRRFVARTGEDGSYSIDRLPSGDATVTVEFIGYVEVSKPVTIGGEAATTLDFELRQAGRRVDEAAAVEEIVVRGEREGQQRSIMEQRAELQIADVMQTETYGDIAGGNPAEFLKYMPGIDVDGSNGTATYVGLRGLPAGFTRTQLNGMDIVSANANAATGYGSATKAARVFSYESMSLSAIDSVTVYKTTSADQNADAPAGIINLQTKRLANRRKPLLVLSVEGMTHENMWDKYRDTGPQANGGFGGQRFLPNASFLYTDSFFGRRLGVSLSASINHQYFEREQVVTSRNFRNSANAPFPLELYAFEQGSYHRLTKRKTGNLVLDFKATSNLTLGALGVFYRGDLAQHATTVEVFADTSTGARGLLNLQGGPASAEDALSGFITRQPATTTTITAGASTAYKFNKGNIAALNFDWKHGGWQADGYYAYSDTHSYYNSPEKGQVASATAINSRGNFSVVKGSPGLNELDFAVTQVSGADWSDPANWTLASARPAVTLSGNAYGKLKQQSGAMNLRYETELGQMPVEFQTGFKITDTIYDFGTTAATPFQYVGPMSNAEFLAAFVSPYTRNVTSKSGFSITSLSGSRYIPALDLGKLWRDYRDNPENWNSTATAAQYRATTYGATDYGEMIKAVYGMVTAKPSEAFSIRLGLRGEWTDNRARVYQSLPRAQILAYRPPGATANCAVSATSGVATTIPCVDYQYSGGQTRLRGGFFNLFPSAQVKATLFDNFDLQAGYSRSVLRSGVDVYADQPSESLTGSDVGGPLLTVPNPNLTPAYSDNFSARLSHYFKTVGMVNLGIYYNKIKGLPQTLEYSQEEALAIPELAPYASDPVFADAGFRYAIARQVDMVSIWGIEAAFQHSFTWLPKPFDGLSLRGAFSHNTPNLPLIRWGRNIASLAMSYEKGPVKVNANLLWNGDKPRTLASDGRTLATWFDSMTQINLSARIKLSRRFETYFTVTNLLNSGLIVMQPGSSVTAVSGFPDFSPLTAYNGRTASIGFRARF